MVINVTRYEKTRLSAGIIILRYGFLKCSQWYLIKTEIISVLYNIMNFLLFDTKFDHERVKKANLQIILFVGQHVINAR